MSAKPLVSVVIPTHNRVQLLPAAIESVLAQSLKAWELLIIDDASTDATPQLVARYAAQDARICAHRQDTNQGNAGTLNTGLALAQGRYLAKLDDDDTAHPDWLRHCSAYLDAHQDAFAIATRQGVRDIHADTPESIKVQMKDLPRFFRVASLKALKGWSPIFPTAEDRDLILRARAKGWTYETLETPLYFHNLSTDTKKLSHSPQMLMAELMLHSGAALRQSGLPAFAEQLEAQLSGPKLVRHIMRAGPVYPNRLAYLTIGWWQLALMPYLNKVRAALAVEIRWGACRMVAPMPNPPHWRYLLAHAWAQTRFARFVLWQRLLFCLAMLRAWFAHARIWARWGLGDIPQHMPAHPTIGLCIVAGNEPARLRAAVQSIQAQTYAHWKLVILTQRARPAIHALAETLAQEDARISCLRRFRHLPMAHILNLMRLKTQASFVGVHPVDAHAHPERLAKCAAALKANPDWAGVGHMVMQNGCVTRAPPSLFRSPHWAGWQAMARPRRWKSTWPRLEDTYVAEVLRLLERKVGHLDVPLLTYDAPLPCPLRRARQSTAQWLTHDLIRRLRRAGIPDMHAQGFAVSDILAAQHGRLRVFPKLVRWALSRETQLLSRSWYRLWRLKNYLRKQRMRWRRFLPLWLWSARQLQYARAPLTFQIVVLWQLLRAWMKPARMPASQKA